MITTQFLLTAFAGYLMGAISIWCALDVHRMTHQIQDGADDREDGTATPWEVPPAPIRPVDRRDPPPVALKVIDPTAPVHDILLIVACSDPMMWYANKVGHYVPYLGEWVDGYKSREPAGYINIVKKADAIIVQVAS